MSRDATLLACIGVVVLVAVVVLGLGALGTTRTTVTSGGAVSFDSPPSDGSYGVVFGLHERPGFSVLGITITSPHFKANVGMVAPEACVSLDGDGQEVLSEEGECADLPAHGEVSGGGTSIEGDHVVIVRVDIPKQCYEALSVGDRWPVDAGACVP